MPESQFLLKIGISFANEYFLHQNFHLKDILNIIKNCYRTPENSRFHKILLDFHNNSHGIHRFLNNSNKTL